MTSIDKRVVTTLLSMLRVRNDSTECNLLSKCHVNASAECQLLSNGLPAPGLNYINKPPRKQSRDRRLYVGMYRTLALPLTDPALLLYLHALWLLSILLAFSSDIHAVIDKMLCSYFELLDMVYFLWGRGLFSFSMFRGSVHFFPRQLPLTLSRQTELITRSFSVFLQNSVTVGFSFTRPLWRWQPDVHLV